MIYISDPLGSIPWMGYSKNLLQLKFQLLLRTTPILLNQLTRCIHIHIISLSLPLIRTCRIYCVVIDNKMQKIVSGTCSSSKKNANIHVQCKSISCWLPSRLDGGFRALIRRFLQSTAHLNQSLPADRMDRWWKRKLSNYIITLNELCGVVLLQR